ncbi:MAG TPA: SPOR domain-containing protein [Acidisarcina sp.]
MRSMVDVDSDPDRNDQPKSDPEVTLGMASLLGIFFGLVILCGAFFGFGYSVGKRYIPASTAAATHTSKAVPVAVDGVIASDQQPQSESQIVKPSADGQDRRAAVASSAANPVPHNSALIAPPQAGSTKRPALPSPNAGLEPPLPATEEPAAPARPERSPANSAFPDYMVQIAAVSSTADGDALIAALRKRGYRVSAYTEPQDKLLHVQIGPFTTRAEANAMRQKLLADGYNAIIK